MSERESTQLELDFTPDFALNTATTNTSDAIAGVLNAEEERGKTHREDDIYCPGCGASNFNGFCSECGTYQDDPDSMSGVLGASRLFDEKYCEKCGRHYFGSICECGNTNIPIYGNFLLISNVGGIKISYKNTAQNIANISEIEFKVEYEVCTFFPKKRCIAQKRYFKIGFHAMPKYRKFFDGTAEDNEVFDGYEIQIIKILGKQQGETFTQIDEQNKLFTIFKRSIFPNLKAHISDILQKRSI